MIKLLISEILKLKHQKRWWLILLACIITLLFTANHYFSLYSTFNSSQLQVYQTIRMSQQNLIAQQESQLPKLNNPTKLLDSIKDNKEKLAIQISLEEALLHNDYQRANQLLITLRSTDAINNKIRLSLIEQDIPTIHLSPVTVGSVLGFFTYLTTTYLWLIITLITIFVGFDLINNECPKRSLQLTFSQPYKRSHIIIVKIILRIFITIAIIISSFAIIYAILQFNHKIGWLNQPVVYSPLSLGEYQFRFADMNIMSLYDYFVLNAVYLILNISLVISFCALINTFINQPHITMILLLTLLIFFYTGLNDKTLLSAIAYCPYFYLFMPAINYNIADPNSLFYHYREARYIYGAILMPLMGTLNIIITLYLYKRKELR